VVGAVSCLSNIPPGFVNIKVIETSLFRGYKKAVKVALGAAFAELTYAAAALGTSVYIQKFPVLVFFLGIFITFFMLFLAYKYFTGKSYAEQIEESKIEFTDDQKKKNHYIYGLGVGLLNPQMFPYWFFFFTITLPMYSIQYVSSYYIAIAGAVIGGFGLLWTYAVLAAKYRRKIFSVFAKYPINKYVGWMFIALAISKIVEMTINYPGEELKIFFANLF
jgi:threonine/homoserine/homoserine lactone efflux protein